MGSCGIHGLAIQGRSTSALGAWHDLVSQFLTPPPSNLRDEQCMCTRWRYQWQPQAGTCLLPNFYSFCVCPQKCEVLVLCRRCRPDRALSRAGGAAQSVQQRSLQAGSALSRVRSAAAREREALAGRKQHWQAAALPLCAAQPKHAPAQPVPGPGCRAPVSQRGRARASCQVRHRVTAKPRGHTLFFCPVAACASQQAGALLPRCASDLHTALQAPAAAPRRGDGSNSPQRAAPQPGEPSQRARSTQRLLCESPRRLVRRVQTRPMPAAWRCCRCTPCQHAATLEAEACSPPLLHASDTALSVVMKK